MKAKKGRKAKALVLVSGMIFGVGMYTWPVVNASTTKPAEGEGALANAAIYAAHCAKCHGADGKANTAKGKRAGSTNFTTNWNTDEARGIRIITNGKGEMPSFKGKLTPAEIRSVFRYVLRFHP